MMKLILDHVAPYVGAWIETKETGKGQNNTESHPTWVRGLKLLLLSISCTVFLSHPTWVRGLKRSKRLFQNQVGQSHPTWVRGLKLCQSWLLQSTLSRTLRGCVD